jgi:hypothetical protein
VIKAVVQVSHKVARSFGLPVRAADAVVIGRGSGARLTPGNAAVNVKLNAKARRALRHSGDKRLTVRVTATDAAGNSTTARVSMRLDRR